MKLDHGMKLCLQAAFFTPFHIAIGYVLGNQEFAPIQILIMIVVIIFMGIGAGVHVLKTMVKVEKEIAEDIRR